MDISMNYLAIFVATFAAFVIGAIWFGPKTFYPVWVKALGVDPNDPQQQAKSTPAGLMFGLTFVAQLAMAFAVALVLELVEAAHGSVALLDGLSVGLVLGVLVAAASSLSHRLFAQQGFKVWAIEVGQDAVAILAMALILAAWR